MIEGKNSQITSNGFNKTDGEVQTTPEHLTSTYISDVVNNVVEDELSVNLVSLFEGQIYTSEAEFCTALTLLITELIYENRIKGDPEGQSIFHHTTFFINNTISGDVPLAADKPATEARRVLVISNFSEFVSLILKLLVLAQNLKLDGNTKFAKIITVVDSKSPQHYLRKLLKVCLRDHTSGDEENIILCLRRTVEEMENIDLSLSPTEVSLTLPSQQLSIIGSFSTGNLFLYEGFTALRFHEAGQDSSNQLSILPEVRLGISTNLATFYAMQADKVDQEFSKGTLEGIMTNKLPVFLEFWLKLLELDSSWVQKMCQELELPEESTHVLLHPPDKDQLIVNRAVRDTLIQGLNHLFLALKNIVLVKDSSLKNDANGWPVVRVVRGTDMTETDVESPFQGGLDGRVRHYFLNHFNPESQEARDELSKEFTALFDDFGNHGFHKQVMLYCLGAEQQMNAINKLGQEVHQTLKSMSGVATPGVKELAALIAISALQQQQNIHTFNFQVEQPMARTHSDVQLDEGIELDKFHCVMRLQHLLPGSVIVCHPDDFEKYASKVKKTDVKALLEDTIDIQPDLNTIKGYITLVTLESQNSEYPWVQEILE
jgi:hypothetical protein